MNPVQSWTVINAPFLTHETEVGQNMRFIFIWVFLQKPLLVLIRLFQREQPVTKSQFDSDNLDIIYKHSINAARYEDGPISQHTISSL